MPFEIAQFLPPSPLHWLTILHYLLLILSFAMLASSEGEVPIMFLVGVAILALSVGVNLYINFFNFGRIYIFLIRLAMLFMPIVLVGIAPNGNVRGLAIIAAVIGLVVLVMGVGGGCLFPFLVEPRSLILCG